MTPNPPELVALLAACRTRPADDLPRLVLADWLEEHGDADRARFVRVQVELSHPSSDVPRTRELKAAEAELLEANERDWLGILAEPASGMMADPALGTIVVRPQSPKWRWADAIRARFDRGLLHMRRFDPDAHLEAARWLASPHADWLEQVSLAFRWPEDFVKLNLPDQLAGRVELTIHADDQLRLHPQHQFRLLTVSSNFAAVRSLAVSRVDAVTVLSELVAADVGRLVKLVLHSCADPAAAAQIVATHPFTSLAALHLGRLDEPAVRILAASPHLGNLTELVLAGCPIGDGGMAALCESPLAHTLTAVEFPNTGIGDSGAAALARSPLVARMHGPKLNLMMNRIGDRGLAALAGCEHLGRYRELVLRENAVGDVGAEALARSPFAANLKYVDFWRNRLTDRGAKALAASPHLEHVAEISVKENAVGEAGIEALRDRFGARVRV